MSDSTELDRKLVSAAEDIKIWQSSEYSLLHRFSPSTANIYRSAHWSWDFRKVISIPSSNYQVSVTFLKGNGPHHLDIPVRDEPTYAQFSNTSASIFAVGSKKGMVGVYDIKQKKMFKSFTTDNSETTCLQFNYNDSYIASGSSKGLITVHNTLSGISNTPFGHSVSYAVCSLHYSYFHKALIGSAYFDGTVTLWDANTRQVNHKFPTVHVAPATGIRFSSLNPLLLISVGLDKKICCYDVSSKKIAKTMDSDVPITCFDFNEDGHTLAVGSAKGKVLIYDLRFLTYPKHTIFAHDSAINCLSFQNGTIGASAREKLARKSEVSKGEASYDFKEGVSSLSSNTVTFSQNDFEPTAGKGRISLTYEVFSPVSDGGSVNQEIVSPVFEKEDSFPHPKEDPSKIFRITKPPVSSKDSLSIFSPLSDTINDTFTVSGKDGSPLLREKSPQVLKVSELAATHTSKRGNINFLNQMKNEGLKSKKLDFPSPSFTPRTVDVAQWPVEKPVDKSLHCMPDISCLTLRGMCSPDAAKTKRDGALAIKNDSTFNNGQSVTVIPPSLDSGRFSNSAKDEFKLQDDIFIDEGHGTGNHTTPITPEAFQVEYMRQYIDDALEEQLDEYRKMYYLRHVQMCKEMEIQREYVESLFASYHADLSSQISNLQRSVCSSRNTFLGN